MDAERNYIDIVGNAGFSVSRLVGVREACFWIVKSAYLHLIDAVAEVLSAFLANGVFPIIAVHFLNGPRVTKAIDLGRDCRLAPYTEKC